MANKASDLYPGKMCFWKPGILCVVHNVEGVRPVVKLDITDKQFKEMGHRVNSGMEVRKVRSSWLIRERSLFKEIGFE